MIQDIILKEYLRALTEEDKTFLEAADFYEDNNSEEDV